MTPYNKSRLDFIIEGLEKGESFGLSISEEIEWYMAVAYMRRNGYFIVKYRPNHRSDFHAVYYATKEPALDNRTTIASFAY